MIPSTQPFFAATAAEAFSLANLSARVFLAAVRSAAPFSSSCWRNSTAVTGASAEITAISRANDRSAFEPLPASAINAVP